MKSLVTLTAAALVATCATASAKTLEYKPYAGFELGYMKTHAQKATVGPVRVNSIFEDNHYTGALVAGARISKHFGIEAFWQRGREEKDAINLNNYLPEGAIPELPINYKLKTTSQLNYAWGLDLNGYLPVTEKLDLFGTIGAGLYNFTHGVEATIIGTTLPLQINQKEDNVFGLRFAAGVEYKINENWATRATFRYVKLDPGALEWTDNLKEVTVGLRYSF